MLVAGAGRVAAATARAYEAEDRVVFGQRWNRRGSRRLRCDAVRPKVRADRDTVSPESSRAPTVIPSLSLSSAFC